MRSESAVKVLGLSLPLVHEDRLEQRYETRLGDWPLRIRRWCGSAVYLELGSPVVFSTEGEHVGVVSEELRTFLYQAARAGLAVVP